MGNKSHKEKLPKTIPNVYSPQLPNSYTSRPNSTIKSILRNGSSKDSSSISSSTSSLSKQTVTFFDEIPNSVNSVKAYVHYRNSSRKSNKHSQSQFTKDLSYSTETLKTAGYNSRSSIRSRESSSGVKIVYAKDYQFNKTYNSEEPFTSECELMPAYSSTFSVRLRPSYHSVVRADSLANRNSVHVVNHNARMSIIESNSYQKTNPNHSPIIKQNQSDLLYT